MKRNKIFNIFTRIVLASALLLSCIPINSNHVSAEIIAPDTIDVKKIAGYSIGLTNKDGGVAEIVKYNSDNEKFYVINGYGQTIDIVSLKGLTSSDTVQQLQKEKSINIADAVNTDTFTYGDLTSLDIHISEKIIVAAVQDIDYTKNGKIIVMNYDGEIKKTFEAGVQPDMVTITSDGKFILSADEAEARGGLEGVDPEGSVSIVEVESGKVTHVKFNDESVIDDDVHIRQNGTKADAVRDLEPEYIAVSNDGKKAFVTLQENNAIATIDILAGKVLSVKSLGYKDHSLPGNELDAARNGKIEIERLPILGSYMPDSVAYVNISGVDYLLTANEGDATEWPVEKPDFVNVAEFKDVKETISLNTELLKGMTADEALAAFERMKNSADFNKLEVLTDRGNDAIYTLGGRSFSIWKADTMELVYDSGSDFETITAQRLPEVFNWSNDDDVFEKRSTKKGPEPEDVKVGVIGDQIYAFVGLERIGGFMTYNITNPKDAKFANYINSREFSQAIAGDVGPEGLDFIPSDISPTGRPLVLVANEVSGTVSVNEIQVDLIKPIEGITLDQTQINLKVGETVKLHASIYPDDTTENKGLIWTSSNKAVAAVTKDGLVTAISDGKATITVQTKNGTHEAKADITVTTPTPPVTEPKPEPYSDYQDLNYNLMNELGNIVFDYPSYPQLSLELTTDKVKELVKTHPNAKVIIKKGDVEVELPLAILEDIGQNVTLKIVPKSFNGAIGPVYDFMIQKEDGTLIKTFGNHKITLKFKVDFSKVKDWKNIIVYFIDAHGKKLEKIVPTKSDSAKGYVWIEAAHFSTYGVFEEASSPNVPKDSKEPNIENPPNNSGGKPTPHKLPITATNSFNLVVIGLLFLALGGIIFFVQRKRKKLLKNSI
ncbi:choice-of-anchor I family protein [Sutcliffiella halmapala]|uniref:choice-of-anchor I family protein n=1 Tax=Sutcliffiella halmapala TaxID=79882 RepID=UPI00099529B8|nr:choice-of-anchor I family protein [Sutcliffiella halmapala]